MKVGQFGGEPLRDVITGEASTLRGCQVVFELGPEDGKAGLLASLEANTGAILVTETRTHFVRDLAESLRHPERVVGVRRFGRLAELVRTPFVGDDTLANVTRELEARGIACILVPDSAGGVVERLRTALWAEDQRAGRPASNGTPPEDVAAFLADHAGPIYQPTGNASDLDAILWGVACHIAADGVRPRDIDRMASVLGIAPFAAMNQVGLATCLERVAHVNNAWLEDFPLPANLRAQAESGRDWNLPVVQVRRESDILVLTIDRPEAYNAVDPDVVHGLHQAIKENRDVRVIVLRGRGPVFSAGADIKAMHNMDDADMLAFVRAGERLLDDLQQGPPCIAAVSGQALGGGFELALGCDLLIAADDARLGLPEVAVGLQPGWGGVTRVRERAGIGAANRLVLTAKPIDATRAHAIGLVDGITARDDLDAMVMDLARDIAAHAPLALRGAKHALRDGVAAEADALLALWRTRDGQEGLAAFTEKRPPVFTGQ